MSSILDIIPSFSQILQLRSHSDRSLPSNLIKEGKNITLADKEEEIESDDDNILTVGKGNNSNRLSLDDKKPLSFLLGSGVPINNTLFNPVKSLPSTSFPSSSSSSSFPLINSVSKGISTKPVSKPLDFTSSPSKDLMMTSEADRLILKYMVEEEEDESIEEEKEAKSLPLIDDDGISDALIADKSEEEENEEEEEFSSKSTTSSFNANLKPKKPPQRRGDLVCKGKKVDSEVIYWKVVEGDEQYESPITPHHNEHHEKYLTFAYDAGGWNNIRMSIMNFLLSSFLSFFWSFRLNSFRIRHFLPSLASNLFSTHVLSHTTMK